MEIWTKHTVKKKKILIKLTLQVEYSEIIHLPSSTCLDLLQYLYTCSCSGISHMLTSYLIGCLSVYLLAVASLCTFFSAAAVCVTDLVSQNQVH